MSQHILYNRHTKHTISSIREQFEGIFMIKAFGSYIPQLKFRELTMEVKQGRFFKFISPYEGLFL